MSNVEEMLKELGKRIDPLIPENLKPQVQIEIKRAGKIAEMKEGIIGCQACALHATCTNKVPGKGAITSDIMFIGESPGAMEDELGIPFVGPSGQMLDKIIEAAKWNRKDIYITNVVKCRPPENRVPTKAEVAMCSGHLQKQIQLVKPKVIICWGATAANALIHPDFKITQEHGKWFDHKDYKMIATYHPSYILRLGENTDRQKKAKWEVWETIQKVKAYQEAQYHV